LGATDIRDARLRATDHHEFAGIYRSALAGLVGYFRAKGVRTEDARDLAHETVLRTLVHLERHGRTRTDLGPLTKTIARNLLVERLRKATPSLVPLSDAAQIVDDAPEPPDRALATERREAVREALRSLTPRHRRVVELWMSGRSPAEIARTLGIKRNAADAILHRARRALASKLGPRALWGLLVLAWFRARASVRDAAQTVASFSPSSAAAVPAGLSLATVGLAALITVTAPAAPSPADAPNDMTTSAARVTAPQRVASRSITERPAATPVRAPAPSAPEPVRYAMTAETEITDPTTGDGEKRGVDFWYDPNANGRGPLDDVIEPLLRNACAKCEQER
jgi:RNA polymerase sigma factor (sigma-70 family)